jgi:transposase
LQTQLVLVKRQILEADRRILAWHRSSDLSRRLEAIPGVGPLIATALVASIPDPHAFGSARDVSAWIGLVPKQNSTGGKERLGSISKAGNRYLRSLLVVRALSVIRRAKQVGYTRRVWLAELMARRPAKVAAIALANKIASIAWALRSAARAIGSLFRRRLEERALNARSRSWKGQWQDNAPRRSIRRSGHPTRATAALTACF